MTAISEIQPSNEARDSGLDYLRVIGLSLVVWQHICSVLDQDRLAVLAGINAGRLGVSIFLVLSGFLAANTVRSPSSWIFARLRRLFPAYWIVIIASLLATIFIGYKPVTWHLAAAQLAGIAWFTHGWQLVNVPTWFISLLLFCYFVAFALHLCQRSGWIAFFTAGFLFLLPVTVIASHTLEFVSIFLIGFGVAKMAPGKEQAFGIAGWLSIFISLSISGLRSSPYICITIAILWIGLNLRSVDFLSQRVADLSYCIYLVHGPIMLAVASAFQNRWWAVVGLGVPLSVLAATGVSVMAAHLDRTITRLYQLTHQDLSVSRI